MVYEDHRHAALTQAREAGEVPGDRGHEHSVDALFAEQVEVGVFAVGAFVAVAEQHAHARFGGAVLGTAGDLGEERVAGVEHDQRDAAAASGAQLPGGVVAHEAEVVDRLQHALDRRR